MSNSVSRILIETMVRKTIREIKDSPQRSMRNLVDMAVHFSDGRFQKRLLVQLQTMLRKENSPYFQVVSDVVSHADTEKLVTFGMNLGYNSCTRGARQIREIESAEHFNVPWSISMRVSEDVYQERKIEYQSLLDQGKELGVYTWMLQNDTNAAGLLDLVKENDDCAFVLYCQPDEVSGEFLVEAQQCRNLLVCVEYEDGVQEACRRLREGHFLYAVHFIWHETDAEQILNGAFFEGAESLHAPFTALLAEKECAPDIQERVYQYVTEERICQRRGTVPWDIIQDSIFIDSIISEESCSVIFDEKGDLFTWENGLAQKDGNLFRQPLRWMLEQHFPHKER